MFKVNQWKKWHKPWSFYGYKIQWHLLRLKAASCGSSTPVFQKLHQSASENLVSELWWWGWSHISETLVIWITDVAVAQDFTERKKGASWNTHSIDTPLHASTDSEVTWHTPFVCTLHIFIHLKTYIWQKTHKSYSRESDVNLVAATWPKITYFPQPPRR